MDIADAVLGDHKVGAFRSATNARERLRWILGIPEEDHASVGVAIAQYHQLYGLLEHRDGCWHRVRREPIDGSENRPDPVVKVHTLTDVMSGADRRAFEVERKLREAHERARIAEEVKEAVRQELANR